MSDTSEPDAAETKPAGFLRRWRNTIFSTADHMWLLILWAVSTPIFIAYLGADEFGVWILINAVIGFGGVLSLGFGEATIRYVALYRGKGQPDDIRRIIDTTMALYVAIGVLCAAGLWLAAPLIATSTFGLDGPPAQEATTALRLAGVALLITAYLKTYEGVINGFERYDITARAGIATRSFVILGNLAMVLVGFGLVALIAAAVVGLLGQTIAYFIITRRHFVPSLRVISLPEWATIKEIGGFGFQTWLQIVGSALNTLADRFLVAAMIDPAAAGVYAICLQLAQQIHLLLARGLAFLMPQTSRNALDEAGLPALIQTYRNGVALVLLMAGAIALPLYVLADQVLTVWVGDEFAASGADALRILAFYFAIAGAYVPAYYLLNGAGRPGWSTMAVLIHSLAGLGLAAALLPSLALPGVGLGRSAALPAYILIIWALHHYVFKGQALAQSLLMLGWLVVLGLVAHALSVTISDAVPNTVVALFGVGILLAVLGAALALAPFLFSRLLQKRQDP